MNLINRLIRWWGCPPADDPEQEYDRLTSLCKRPERHGRIHTMPDECDQLQAVPSPFSNGVELPIGQSKWVCFQPADHLVCVVVGQKDGIEQMFDPPI